MCPNNRLGTADLLIVGHHGQPISNSEVMVHALRPRVSILNNGTRKGGQPPAMRVILNSPGLEDLWQVHFSLLSGQEYTVPGMFISNVVDEQPANIPIGALEIGPGGGGPPAPGATPPPPPPAHNGKGTGSRFGSAGRHVQRDQPAEQLHEDVPRRHGNN